MSQAAPVGKSAWGLDPEADFLNHGSFGACPLEVLARQQLYRNQMERQPVAFLHRELEPRLDHVRQTLASTVGGHAENLVFVRNATEGVNTALQAADLSPGDGILVTDHGYNACGNAVRRVAKQRGCEVHLAEIRTPVENSSEIIDAILAALRPTTRWAVLDHVTSATAIVFPIAELVRHLRARGVSVIVDGAHAPGMVALAVERIGADFYTGNCHKWLCAPKGAAFLSVAPRWHDHTEPLVTSHGANSTRTDRSRLHLQFDWTGTQDPTAWLAIGDAIAFWQRQPGGLDAAMAENRSRVLYGRRVLSEECGFEPTVREEACIGAIASLRISARGEGDPPQSPLGIDPLQQQLWDHHRIEVPVFCWPAPPSRLLRISAQRYNGWEQFARLGRVLRTRFGFEKRRG